MRVTGKEAPGRDSSLSILVWLNGCTVRPGRRMPTPEEHVLEALCPLSLLCLLLTRYQRPDVCTMVLCLVHTIDMAVPICSFDNKSMSTDDPDCVLIVGKSAGYNQQPFNHFWSGSA